MAVTEAIDRVGLGVDLLGGPELLSQLRQIRAEMTEIAALGRRGNGGSSIGSTSIEADYLAQNRRIERLASESQRRITQTETQANLSRRERQAELNRQMLLEEERQQGRIARVREQAQKRIGVYANTSTITSAESIEQNAQQRALFKRYRNDPARDPQTNLYRSQLAEQTVAQRQALRIQQADYESYLSQRAARTKQDFESQLGQRRANAARARETFGPANAPIENDRWSTLTPESARARFGPTRSEAGRLRIQQLEDELAYGRGGSATARDVNRPLTRPISEPPGLTVGPQGQPIRTVGGQRGYFSTGRKGEAVFNPLGGGPPTGGGPAEEPEEPEGGGGGGRGGLGTVGRLTRNFLIYRALTTVTFGLINYTKESLAAAKATSEQANALLFATEAANGNLAANRALATSLGQVGYNRAEAAQTVGAAARATYRHPELTGALTRESVNIAALRGGGLQETPRIIEDIIGGRDRAYREYFNITPEEIYKEAAKKKVAQSTNITGLTTIGKQDYETDTQKIARYISALTEEEKEQLRLNYALSQSFRFEGDAAERAGTLAGRMDLVSAAFFNASANVGAFIADIRPVKDLLDSIANRTPSNVFTPPQLGQTGPRNTITDTDVTRFGGDTVIGPRANALGYVSRYFQWQANNITLANTAVNIGRNIQDRISNYRTGTTPVAEEDLDKIIAENIARDKQVRQRNVLREQGQLGYRNITPGQGDPNNIPNEYSTYAQLRAKGISGGDILKNYIEDIRPLLTDGAKALEEYNRKYRELQDTIDSGTATDSDKKNAKNAQFQLDAERDAALFAGFKPKDYDEQARKREDERKQKEAERRNDAVRRLGQGLSKLREAEQGAFRLPGDIATTIEGSDNPYVKVLSDEATAAERMRQQWGFLGKAATDYFTKIEQGSIKRQLNKLEYDTYTTASNLRGQADKEGLERIGPGLSKREQQYLDVQSAIVDRAVEIPKLWQQAAEVLQQPQLSLKQFLRGQLSLISQAFGVAGPKIRNIYGQDVTPGDRRLNAFGQDVGGTFEIQRRRNVYGQSLDDPSIASSYANLGIGQSPEVREALRKSFAESILGAFQGLSASQIRSSGFQDVYAGAIASQGVGLNYRIREAQQKAQIGAVEDQRLARQLRDDEAFRQSQLRQGYDAKDVGRASDALLIARTNGIPQRDLSFEQFKNRQEALRRTADTAESDRNEAKAAVLEGLRQQAAILGTIESIRAGLFGGDNNAMKLLVQLENNTQASVDQKNLQQLATGNYNVPLDNSNEQTSPYTSSFDKYSRGGRKR